MKKVYYLTIILLTAVVLGSCKKDKKDTEPTPTPIPADTYNPPPASGGFIMANFADKGFCWTSDFITFQKYSTKFQNTWLQYSYAGDTLVVNNGTSGKVLFGNIFNPADFKTINTSKPLHAVSYIKGVIIGYVIDNNNYYIGYCDFKNGQTDMNFTLLNSGAQFDGTFYYLGYAVVSLASVNSIKMLAVTKDGKTWSFKSLAPSFPISSELVIRNYNNIIHAISDYGFSISSDTSLVSTSWVNNLGVIGINNSDSAGVFHSYKFRREGSNWVGYGYIYNSASGNNIPAKNVSTDNGTTFTTELLTGIPVGKWYSYILTKTHAVITYWENSEYKAFISTDFKNFAPYSGSAVYNDFSGMYPAFIYYE